MDTKDVLYGLRAKRGLSQDEKEIKTKKSNIIKVENCFNQKENNIIINEGN